MRSALALFTGFVVLGALLGGYVYVGGSLILAAEARAGTMAGLGVFVLWVFAAGGVWAALDEWGHSR